MNEKLRIVIADDHPLFREGVVKSINETNSIEVVGEAGNAAEAYELVERLLPDLVCVDISMPGGGISAVQQISIAFPTVKVMILTVSEADDDVSAALEAGAAGYLLKGVSASQLVEAVKEVAEGRSYVSPGLAARLLRTMNAPRPAPIETPLDSLTKREAQILELVAEGMSNKEVGRALNLQEKTIKHYMTNILQKLQVRNRVEAALLARER